jgi:2-succinyl-5-enolpyruvyl-6-hydroxy-3-cyclohexene-1-carboxylate synthase
MGEQSYFTNIDNAPNTYADAWKEHNEQARNLFNELINNGLNKFGFTEFEAVTQVMSSLPQQSHLHLANSMSVRYANFVGLSPKQEVKVWSNRGTSGIDGCTATAVGTALATTEIVTLITGDVAFFYDRNALWHNYLPNNLRIILLNNNGGGIFKMIDGPARQPEASEYFETYQALNAERTCADAGIAHTHCNNETELTLALQNFFAPDTRSKLLEISTKTENNATFFAEIKRSLAAYNVS